jgi:hypothetical protein
MNLGVLKETRQVGDIFVMQPPDGSFLYGRVIDISAAIGPMRGCILIYVSRRPPMTEYSGTDPHHPGAGLCPVRTATHEAARL